MPLNVGVTILWIAIRLIWLAWGVYLISQSAIERAYLLRLLSRFSSKRVRLIALVMVLKRGQDRRMIYVFCAIVIGAMMLAAKIITIWIVLVWLLSVGIMATAHIGLIQARREWRIIERIEQRSGQAREDAGLLRREN